MNFKKCFATTLLIVSFVGFISNAGATDSLRLPVQLENGVENQESKEDSAIIDTSPQVEIELTPHIEEGYDKFEGDSFRMDGKAGVIEKWFVWNEFQKQGDRIKELEREVDRRIVKEIEEYKRRKECDRFCRQTPPEDDGYEYVDD